jgi:UDP-N-acetylmuramoyl-L-alanyl-D-glutamate--2,6-diaminopimelate ligase
MKKLDSKINDILDWLKQTTRNSSGVPSPDQIVQLSSDSREVRRGDVFFSFPVKGAGDGRQYIASAVVNGASAVLYEAKGFEWDASINVPHLAVNDLRAAAGVIANAWYGEPDRDMLTVAVTGTNGKTSCSQWLAKTLSIVGEDSAVIGTLGVGNYHKGSADNLEETGFTTPDAIQLQRRLAQLKARGAKALAIEASSIGLDQGRMNGLRVDVAVFTNLTRDHLDYHGDMETYAAAKARLFKRLELSAAIVNLDDPFSGSLIRSAQEVAAKIKIIGYSVEAKIRADIGNVIASHVRTNYAGTTFHVETPYGAAQVKTHLIGRFNVSNVLAVLSTLLVRGIPLKQAVAAIEKLAPVPGRMQQLGSQGHAMVVIDYAHTPDALEKTLLALRQIALERHGELWCVFGCGGDRDPGKRPQMGKVAELAQHVVVTSDNPRTENPADIITQIVRGMHEVPHIIEDRASAILYAIKHAGDHDVVLLAGKGHESYQDINGKKTPFSDEEHAALALATVATSSMSNHIKRAS